MARALSLASARELGRGLWLVCGGMQGSNMLQERPGACAALARHTCSNFALFTLGLVRGKDAADLWKVDIGSHVRYSCRGGH